MKVRFTLANSKPLTTCISKSTYEYIYNRWKAGQDVELGHKRTILNSEIEEIEVLENEE